MDVDLVRSHDINIEQCICGVEWSLGSGKLHILCHDSSSFKAKTLLFPYVSTRALSGIAADSDRGRSQTWSFSPLGWAPSCGTCTSWIASTRRLDAAAQWQRNPAWATVKWLVSKEEQERQSQS